MVRCLSLYMQRQKCVSSMLDHRNAQRIVVEKKERVPRFCFHVVHCLSEFLNHTTRFNSEANTTARVDFRSTNHVYNYKLFGCGITFLSQFIWNVCLFLGLEGHRVCVEKSTRYSRLAVWFRTTWCEQIIQKCYCASQKNIRLSWSVYYFTSYVHDDRKHGSMVRWFSTIILVAMSYSTWW